MVNGFPRRSLWLWLLLLLLLLLPQCVFEFLSPPRDTQKMLQFVFVSLALLLPYF